MAISYVDLNKCSQMLLNDEYMKHIDMNDSIWEKLFYNSIRGNLLITSGKIIDNSIELLSIRSKEDTIKVMKNIFHIQDQDQDIATITEGKNLSVLNFAVTRMARDVNSDLEMVKQLLRQVLKKLRIQNSKSHKLTLESIKSINTSFGVSVTSVILSFVAIVISIILALTL